MNTLRVGIAGAGLLGRLLAFALARAGHAVAVFDPAPDALARHAAGWTAAGMLSPVAELDGAEAEVFELGLHSLALWPRLLAALPQPVEFHQRGSLLLAHRGDEGAAQRVIARLRHKAPPSHHPVPLTLAELHTLEPSVQGPAQAWSLPQEGQIHAEQALRALHAGACEAGAQFHWGQTVQQVRPGELVTATTPHAVDLAIDVRGVGAATDPGLADQPRVRGVRGEMFWLHAPGLGLQRPLRLLHPRHRVYLVPRGGDQVLVGASEIESDDRSPVSVRSLLELLSAAHSVLPALAEARLLHHEANLRPALPDHRPRTEHAPGLLRLNGLFRHGWLLAPALVARALASAGLSSNEFSGRPA